MTTKLLPFDRFFHQRITDPFAFSLCGYLRMAHAFLILCDRLLLSVDFHWFFLSGMIPFDANSKDLDDYEFTIFRFVPPDAASVYWGVHILGMVQAVLLFLGIYPKFQLLCLHFNMLSFHNHNGRIWDGEDSMFRLWNLFLLLLPIDQITLYDRFRLSKRNQGDVDDDVDTPSEPPRSWPMWPFRLWQFELCFIYFGASFGKLQNPRWRLGDAMHHVIHTNDFFGGCFTPDILYNRVGPLRLLTWSSLALESLSPITVWIAPKLTVVGMVLLHLGIETSMSMHCFEWLSIVGWLSCLVQPKKDADDTAVAAAINVVRPRTRVCITLGMLLAFGVIAYQTTPLENIFTLGPTAMEVPIAKMIAFREQHPVPFLHYVGWSQNDWDMYSAAPSERFYYEAYDDDDNVLWTSPRWEEVTTSWLVQKRWQRPMSFFDGLEGASRPAMEAFAWYLVEQQNVTTALHLVKHVFEPVDEFWDKMGKYSFWDTARYDVAQTEANDLFSLNVCADWHDLCAERADRDGCLGEGFPWMRFHCRKSCNFCSRVQDLVVGARIVIYLEPHEMFVDAMIHDVRKNKFLLDYGPNNSYEERFEWVDLPSLRSRNYVLLAESGNVQQGVPGDASPVQANSVKEEL